MPDSARAARSSRIAAPPVAIRHEEAPGQGRSGSAASRRLESVAPARPVPAGAPVGGHGPARQVRPAEPAAGSRAEPSPSPAGGDPGGASVDRARPARAAAIAAYLDRHMPAAAAAVASSPAPSPASRKLDRPITARSPREEAGRPAPVKIHIGRIRVDGPAPPPKRPRFRRPRPLVSLADYEDRRQKR